MIRGLNPRWLVGRTITAVEMNPQKDDAGNTYHRPRITLDNGAAIVFMAEETEHLDYGTNILYIPARRNR